MPRPPRQAACSLCVQLSDVLAEHIEPHCAMLARALLPALAHQHSRVRTAAVEALPLLLARAVGMLPDRASKPPLGACGSAAAGAVGARRAWPSARPPRHRPRELGGPLLRTRCPAHPASHPPALSRTPSSCLPVALVRRCRSASRRLARWRGCLPRCPTERPTPLASCRTCSAPSRTRSSRSAHSPTPRWPASAAPRT